MITKANPLSPPKIAHSLRTALAVLLPLCAMVLSICFMGLRYRSNDDAMLCAIASGALGDSVHLIFSNVLLGYLITGLNALVFANWYFILQLVFIAISLSVLCHTFVRRFGLPAGLCFMLLILAGFSVNMYYFVQFTVSAFVMVSCGLLLVAEHLGERNTGTALGILLTWIGSLFRFSCFLAAGALSAALLLYRFCVLDGKKKRTAVITMLVIFVLVFAAFGIDKLAYRSEEWQLYNRYNLSRSRYSDYASLSLTEENPFAALGISDIDYVMLQSWNFYDPARFTPELLDLLSDKVLVNNTATATTGSLQLMRQLFSMKTQHGQTAILALLLTVLFFRPKKSVLISAATALLFLLLTFVLQLQYGGRLTPWLQVGLLFSLSVYLIYLLPDHREKLSRLVLLPLMLCALIVYPARQDYSDYHLYTPLALQNYEDNHIYFRHMSEDSESLYLISVTSTEYSLCADVWRPNAEGFFGNIVSLGGWTSGHPGRIAALAEYGINRPIVDAVDNPNVYFDYHDIEAVAAYASQELGCEVVAVATGQNAYCSYQLMRVNRD